MMKHFFQDKSLIVYVYNNYTNIADILLSSKEETTFNIDVAEGRIIEDEKDKDGSNICINENSYVLYIETNKIVDKEDIVFNITKHAVELEYEEGVYHIDKPVLYFYPKEPTDIEVKLGKPRELLVSYPKYEDSWNFKAYEDGTLEMDGNKYYSLYYESNGIMKNGIREEGFCVPKEKILEFLEEKLDILGLNYKEKEEFIIYWLPKLQQNDYNYIHFLSREEIEENMPITISPAPDKFIRISMEWKGLKRPIEIKEQKLTPSSREGFTVIEWGGIDLDKFKNR